MKAAIIVLCLLPLAFGALLSNRKKVTFWDPGVLLETYPSTSRFNKVVGPRPLRKRVSTNASTVKVLDTAELKSLVNVVVANFGTDATEQQCETECANLFKSDILDKGCDFACLSIQSLIKRFHIA